MIFKKNKFDIKSAFTIILSVFFLLISTSSSSSDNKTLPNTEKTTVSKNHERFIRKAFDLAISAAKNGNEPFGALLVYQGKIILTAENTINTDNNILHHAEIDLMAKAKREIPPEILKECIMYSSTAPCMLCCASIWYMGITKVVYGVSYKAFSKLTDFDDKSIPCDKLHEYTGRKLEWVGPVLENEGLEVFWYWPQDSFRPSLVEKLEALGIARPGISKPR